MRHQSCSPSSVRRQTQAVCLIVAVVASTSVSACAASTGAASSERSAAAPTASPSRYVLGQAELEKARVDNAYDAIARLRPEFLRGRNENSSFVQQGIKGGSKDPGAAPGSSGSSVGGATVASSAAIMVYKDNVRIGGVDDLRQMQLSTIREIRYLPGPDAVIRYGADHSAGAILITSK